MSFDVIPVVGPIAEHLVEPAQRPNGEPLRVIVLRDLTHVARDLRVAFEIMDELFIDSVEEPLYDSPEAWLRSRTGFDGGLERRHEHFKILAMKFAATIDNNRLRKTA